MAWWLRAMVALPEVLGSILSTLAAQLAAHNLLKGRNDPFTGLTSDIRKHGNLHFDS
jgi:hypothetical protein